MIKTHPRFLLIAGSLSAAAAVALGAFGAHGLRNAVQPDMLAVFETAVRYQMYHAFGLLITGVLAQASEDVHSRMLRWSGVCFGVGTILFSGSLYLLVVLDQRWLGVITPFGGLLFIAGWILLAWTYLRGR